MSDNSAVPLKQAVSEAVMWINGHIEKLNEQVQQLTQQVRALEAKQCTCNCGMVFMRACSFQCKTVFLASSARSPTLPTTKRKRKSNDDASASANQPVRGRPRKVSAADPMADPPAPPPTQASVSQSLFFSCNDDNEEVSQEMVDSLNAAAAAACDDDNGEA